MHEQVMKNHKTCHEHSHIHTLHEERTRELFKSKKNKNKIETTYDEQVAAIKYYIGAYLFLSDFMTYNFFA